MIKLISVEEHKPLNSDEQLLEVLNIQKDAYRANMDNKLHEKKEKENLKDNDNDGKH